MTTATPTAQRQAGPPTFVLLVGLPGTGKSTLARHIARHLPVEIVQTDAVRKALFPTPRYTPEEHQRVYETAHRIIEQLLFEQRNVVFDATNLHESRRRALYDIAANAQANLVVVLTVAPPEVVRRRLDRRQRQRDAEDFSDATWEVYQRMSRELEPIPRPHLVVNTAVDLEPAVERILALARRPTAGEGGAPRA
jgi:predicted kinase